MTRRALWTRYVAACLAVVFLQMAPSWGSTPGPKITHDDAGLDTASALTTENGYYSASVTGPDAITFTAISAQGYGNVTADLGADGKLTNFGYTGDFQ